MLSILSSSMLPSVVELIKKIFTPITIIDCDVIESTSNGMGQSARWGVYQQTKIYLIEEVINHMTIKLTNDVKIYFMVRGSVEIPSNKEILILGGHIVSRKE